MNSKAVRGDCETATQAYETPCIIRCDKCTKCPITLLSVIIHPNIEKRYHIISARHFLFIFDQQDRSEKWKKIRIKSAHNTHKKRSLDLTWTWQFVRKCSMSLLRLANCMFVSTLCTMLCFCWQINDDDDAHEFCFMSISSVSSLIAICS